MSLICVFGPSFQAIPAIWLYTGLSFSCCLPVIISAIVPLKNTEYGWTKSLHKGYEVEGSVKIQIFSDLHIEFEDLAIDTCGADVVVLAGDIHTKDRGLKWAIENIPDIPVMYVLGNHEFYGGAYPKLVDTLKTQAAGTNVHILEKGVVHIDGVNFLGCTLWTDFNLFGDPRLTGYECQQLMTDYRRIRISPRYSKLRSVDVAAIHRQSLEWITKTLEQHAGECNVVVTHHAPSVRSLPKYRAQEAASAAYASNLDHVIEEYAPAVWIHGHLHNSSDYHVGDCRVVCNPRGYAGEENSEFMPACYIEVQNDRPDP